MKDISPSRSDWKETRLRFLLNNYRSDEEMNCLKQSSEVTFLPMEAVSERGGLDLSIIRPKDEVEKGYTLFFDNDVLIAKITPCFENGKGALAQGLFGGVGYGTTELYVLNAGSDLLPEFLFYLTISDEFRINGEAAMKGAAGQKRVPNEFIQNFRVCLPQLDIQKQIADYLDRETTEIDALIAEKEHTLALLEEKREVLISHIVIHGIDPSVPMKYSGLGWLGNIPQNWNVTRLKFIADVQTGITLGKNYQNEELILCPYLRVANVQDGFLDLNVITEIYIPKKDICRYQLKYGDVLMTEGGDFDKLGRGYVWEGQIEKCLHQNHIFAVRPFTKYLDSYFLAILMKSHYGRAYFISTSKQTTNLATTNQTNLLNFYLPVPPMNEQKSIVEYLNNETGKIDELLTAIKDSIALLKERRSALITAAVTGQIAPEMMS